MKKLLLFVFILGFLNLQAQKYTLSGFVSDSDNGEILIGAIVYVDQNNVVATNEFGYYCLNINKPISDTLVVKVSMIGYKEVYKKVNLKKETRIDFNLKFNNQIDSVIVNSRIPKTKNTDIGSIEIPINQLKLLPAIGSESDVFKALQLMPGVQSGNEGSSNLYVRGGAPDENLILLDDVPLYYVSHLAGFVSVFNTDALKSVKLLKGGFPARYAGRLSSIIDIRMKDGNMNSFHGNFDIGLVDTKFLYEGPIIKNKASFIISARILPLSLLTKPFFLLTNQGQMLGYNFHDINLKFNYILDSKNRLFFSSYTGDDRLSINSSAFYNSDQIINYHMVWGNRLAAFRWNHIFNQRFFVNTTASYTQFRYNNILKSESQDENKFFNFKTKTSIKDFSLKSIFDFEINKNYKIKFGYNSVYHIFNPDYSYLKITESDTIKTLDKTENNLEYGLENRIFIENNLKISNFFNANLGINFTDYSINKVHFPSLEPRIVINFMLPQDFSVKISFSQMQQFVHLLSNNSIGLNPDIWIPSNSDLPPSISKQFSFGLFKSLPKKDIEISIVSYYKLSNNLITYKEGAVFIGNAENWEDKIEKNGKGISYGIEFLVQKMQGKTTGWISYTYANSTRSFQNINNGKEYPYKYDRRHDFTIVVNHKISENIDFSVDWIFGSGYPYTLAIAAFYSIDDGTFSNNQSTEFNLDQTAYVYSDRNSFRMRAYHRLDLAINFSKHKKNGIRTWTFSVYNAYNRQNPYFYFTNYDKTDNKIHIFQQSLFPIIPSLSYSFKF